MYIVHTIVHIVHMTDNNEIWDLVIVATSDELALAVRTFSRTFLFHTQAVGYELITHANWNANDNR